MRRREFLGVLGGVAVTWPVAAPAQQTAPLIGFLRPASAASAVYLLAAFKRGLSETGIEDGQNVRIENFGEEGREDRLPEQAIDLVRRQAAVIVTPGSLSAAIAARKATATIPIVFAIGSDPVRAGLVTSLNRPAGNATGVSFFSNELMSKRLGLLHELLPRAARIAVFVNPSNANADAETREAQEAANALGHPLIVVNARTENDIDLAFASFEQERIGALLIHGDPFFSGRRFQLIGLASRLAIPAIYSIREFAAAGGLMTYGTNFEEIWRQLGIYTGRILRGEKPENLPVVRPTKFDLVINLQAAKTIRLDIPATLLARADEVIE